MSGADSPWRSGAVVQTDGARVAVPTHPTTTNRPPNRSNEATILLGTELYPGPRGQAAVNVERGVLVRSGSPGVPINVFGPMAQAATDTVRARCARQGGRRRAGRGLRRPSVGNAGGRAQGPPSETNKHHHPLCRAMSASNSVQINSRRGGSDGATTRLFSQQGYKRTTGKLNNVDTDRCAAHKLVAPDM